MDGGTATELQPLSRRSMPTAHYIHFSRFLRAARASGFSRPISAGERGCACSQRANSWTCTVCSVSGCFTLTVIGVGSRSLSSTHLLSWKIRSAWGDCLVEAAGAQLDGMFNAAAVAAGDSAGLEGYSLFLR
jgi:hypothetical protein